MPEAVVERWLPHAPGRVWQAVTEPALAERWLPFQRYSAEAGGRFTARTPRGPVDCEIRGVTPRLELVIGWNEGKGPTSTVSIALMASGDGTHVTIRHDDPDVSRRDPNTTLWEDALHVRLDQVLPRAEKRRSRGPLIAALVALGLGGLGVVVCVGGWLVSGTEPEIPVVVAEPVTVPDTAPEPDRGPTLRLAERETPSTLHPLFPQSQVDVRAISLIFDPFFERDATTGAVRSAIASSWSAKGATLELTLREGLVFHDGHPADAEDVCFSVRTVLDRSLDTTLPFVRRGDLLGCDVIDPRTASLTFSGPVPDPETRAAVPLLPMHAFDRSPTGRMSIRPVGTGPYTGELSRASVRFEANPHAAERPAFGVITVEVAAPEVAAAMLGRGEIDGVIDLPSTLASGLDRDAIRVEGYDLRSIVFVALEPIRFADAGRRRAVESALDRAALCRALTDAASTDCVPISGPFLPGSPLANPSIKVTSTRPGGGGGEVVRVGVDAGLDRREPKLVDLILERLGSAGFRVERVRGAPHPDAMDLWIGNEAIDLGEVPERLLRKGPLGARSDALDRLLDRLHDATTEAARKRAGHEVHALVAQERWLIPLWAESTRSAFRAEVVQPGPITPGTHWRDVRAWTPAASAETPKP